MPDPTTIHWHEIEVQNAMNGMPRVTQDPIHPGETFTHEFIAKPAAGEMREKLRELRKNSLSQSA